MAVSTERGTAVDVSEIRETRPSTLLQRIWRARLLYLLVIPSIAFVIMFSYIPAASGIYHAFTRWSGGKEVTWIGLDNFKFMLDDLYLKASWMTLVKA